MTPFFKQYSRARNSHSFLTSLVTTLSARWRSCNFLRFWRHYSVSSFLKSQRLNTYRTTWWILPALANTYSKSLSFHFHPFSTDQPRDYILYCKSKAAESTVSNSTIGFAIYKERTRIKWVLNCTRVKSLYPQKATLLILCLKPVSPRHYSLASYRRYPFNGVLDLQLLLHERHMQKCPKLRFDRKRAKSTPQQRYCQ